MREVAFVTCSGTVPGLAALGEATRATGLGTETIVASSDLPYFDARPGDGYPSRVRAVRSMFERADGFVFAVVTTASGCPGSVLNLLQLLGGPVYDTGERAQPLAGRPVLLRVAGEPRQRQLASEQLQAAVAALGGVLVAESAAEEGEEASEDWVAEALDALLNGPTVATMPPPVDLGLGHVHLPMPAVVVDTLRREAGGISLYAPQRGLGRLRSAVARRLHPTQAGRDVLVTLGASGALAASLAAHLGPGDGVLVPDPGFPNYRTIVEARGMDVLPYRLVPERGFLPDMDELASLAPDARAIVWNFPHNPTGAVAPMTLVESLVDVADEHDLLILSDEVYTDLVWDPDGSVGPAQVGGQARTIVVGSCSKTFAMAGHRIGWAVAPPALLEPVRRVHWAEHMSPPTLGQQAATAALDALDDVLPPLRRTLLASRDAALAELDGSSLVDHEPGGAFYLWLDIGESATSPADYAAGIAREYAVTVMPGEAFGDTGAHRVRVSFAAPPGAVASGCRRVRAYHERHTT